MFWASNTFDWESKGFINLELLPFPPQLKGINLLLLGRKIERHTARVTHHNEAIILPNNGKASHTGEMMNHSSIIPVRQDPEGSLLMLDDNLWELFFRFTFLFLFTFSFSLESQPTCGLILKLFLLILRYKHVDVLWMTDAMTRILFFFFFALFWPFDHALQMHNHFFPEREK